MSTQEKRQRSKQSRLEMKRTNGARINIVVADIRISGKSPIATPPRAALSGRPSREPQAQAEAQSSESSPEPTSEAKTAASREPADNGGHGGDDKDTRIAYLEKEIAIM